MANINKTKVITGTNTVFLTSTVGSRSQSMGSREILNSCLDPENR